MRQSRPLLGIVARTVIKNVPEGDGILGWCGSGGQRVQGDGGGAQ